MEDILTNAVSFFIGIGFATLFLALQEQRTAGKIKRLEGEVHFWKQDSCSLITKIIALRKNCFITNERGHRVRYANASPELRAKAEQE